NAFSQYARSPEMELSRFDLNQLLSEVAELYRPQAGHSRVKLHLHPALPDIDAERGRMRQIVHNLLVNSIEALEGALHAEIRVETRLIDRGGTKVAEVVVED